MLVVAGLVRTPTVVRRLASGVALAAALFSISGCSADDQPEVEAPSPSATADPTTPPSPEPSTTEAPPPEPVTPDDLDPAIALAAVRHLAGDIGPREATGEPYARAADWVAGSFTAMGYDVARQRVDAPAGLSWDDVPVPAGRSENVVATPAGFDPAEPHLVVGAHLDTVPQAPGAEDNASGIGVMLAVAEAVSERTTRLPVVFVAFGAEEPRGPSDDDHHFGSRRYVVLMSAAERSALRGMVAMDRVGVGVTVPIGSAGRSDPVQRALLAAARRAGVPAVADQEQRSSDHWSFVRAGLPGARLGSTPYAGYHSAGDVPSVVQPAQLRRVGRVVLAWLAPR